MTKFGAERRCAPRRAVDVYKKLLNGLMIAALFKRQARCGGDRMAVSTAAKFVGRTIAAFGFMAACAFSGSCGATDYLAPVDDVGEAWIFDRSEIEPMKNGQLKIHFMQIVNPAAKHLGLSVHYSNWLVVFDCKSRAYQVGSVFWLDDDLRQVGQSLTKNLRLTDPISPKADTNWGLAIDAVCAAQHTLTWTHSDERMNDIAIQKLVVMQATKSLLNRN